MSERLKCIAEEWIAHSPRNAIAAVAARPQLIADYLASLKGLRGTEEKGKKGLKGKEKKLPPPPEIRALRATWNAVIERKLRDEDTKIPDELDYPKLRVEDTLQNILEAWALVLLRGIREWISLPPCPGEEMSIRGGDGVTVTHREVGRADEDRFFFGLCPVSFVATDDLKACSGCLSVSYAGREEQKSHWKRHKAVCKVLKRFCGASSAHSHPLSGRPEMNGEVQSQLRSAVARDLTQFESDMLVYPRLCNVCLDGCQNSMMNCRKCHCAAYCCRDHMDADAVEHAKSCGLLAKCLSHYRTTRLSQRDVESIVSGLTPRIVSGGQCGSDDHAPLPATIEDVFRADLDLLIRLKHPHLQAAHDVSECALRQITFDYTCPLSVLYGIQQSGILRRKKGGGPESMVVHVVGARSAESSNVARWEILARGMPRLRRLSVVFVGPELRSPYPLTSFAYSSPYLAAARPDLTVDYSFVSASYHAYAADRASFVKPDCVAALNCGFVFYKSWDKSIPEMLKFENVPLIFTEYYKMDCELNLEKVDSLVEPELTVMVEPGENPFCSSLPARIPTGFAFRQFKRRNVVMSNDFICVVKWVKD